MSHVISVNLAHPRPNPTKSDVTTTGIDKRPVDRPVAVRAPGPRDSGLGSGLVGDGVYDRRHHGGDDQAVYAYARENLDMWAREFGRELGNGSFGENLTTSGLDLEAALIGERWRVGEAGPLLEVSVPRIPCATFAHWLDERRWVRRFTERALPGTYLRVIEPGEVHSGAPITIVSRPSHDVTIGICFRALTLEPDLLPRLLDIAELPDDIRDMAHKRITKTPSPSTPQPE